MLKHAVLCAFGIENTPHPPFGHLLPTRGEKDKAACACPSLRRKRGEGAQSVRGANEAAVVEQSQWVKKRSIRKSNLTLCLVCVAIVGWAPGPPPRRSPHKLSIKRAHVRVFFCEASSLIPRAVGQEPTLLATGWLFDRAQMTFRLQSWPAENLPELLREKIHCR